MPQQWGRDRRSCQHRVTGGGVLDTVLGCAAALRDRTLTAIRAAAAIGEALRPWRSVATWYLWRTLDPVPVAY